MSMISFHLWCTLWSSVWIWMKSNLLRLVESQTHFSNSWHAKNEFDVYWADLECSLFKPPYYLQACTAYLPNMEGVECKTTKSRPKVMLRYRIILMWFHSKCQYARVGDKAQTVFSVLRIVVLSGCNTHPFHVNNVSFLDLVLFHPGQVNAEVQVDQSKNQGKVGLVFKPRNSLLMCSWCLKFWYPTCYALFTLKFWRGIVCSSMSTSPKFG